MMSPCQLGNNHGLSIDKVVASVPIDEAAVRQLVDKHPTRVLAFFARLIRDVGHGDIVTYSPKVFLPLTQLCRDVCHYCTFAKAPRELRSPFASIGDMVASAKAGAEVNCHEALFTLGDKPELRYTAAAKALETLGYPSTLAYLADAAKQVFDETGLLPHLNPGLMNRDDITALRRISVSMGIMLENVSDRLCEKGGVHHGSADKRPEKRLETIRLAGELGVPFSTGILIGIGETRQERIDSLMAIRRLHLEYGHIQEVIVQRLCPKPGTVLAEVESPSLEDLIWTIAVARIVLGPDMNIQAPPNLTPHDLRAVLDAGINDWGGISPVTQDYVNPEAPWPPIEHLAEVTRESGKTLLPRLPIYPAFAAQAERWLDPKLRSPVSRLVDAEGYPRTDDWVAGKPGDQAASTMVERLSRHNSGLSTRPDEIVGRMLGGNEPTVEDVAHLFAARGDQFEVVCRAADELRQAVNGDQLTYVVNRNINYTNICSFKCGFCAFSRGKIAGKVRDKPYRLNLEDIARRTEEALTRGATEVCLQGGIHPEYTGETYLQICRAVKRAAPSIHIHAFSPLEIYEGARTLGISVEQFLGELKAAGLGSLPGTAAEILDDDVRQILCPDKLNTEQWLSVIGAAHDVGLPTTSTIMFGHVDRPEHWARHMLHLRRLQQRTHGITEFVPLPFVHTEAPIYLRGLSRRGPTLREAVLMHAVARLVLYPHIKNVQVSWVKMGRDGVKACLSAGVNDIGGTLMNESISRAAGASFGQELSVDDMRRLADEAGRTLTERTTSYQNPERQSPARAAECHQPARLVSA